MWRHVGAALATGALLAQVPVEASEHDSFQLRAPRQTAWQGYLSGAPHSRASDLTGPVALRSLAAAQTCEQVHATASVGPLRIGWDIVEATGVDANTVNLVNTQIMGKAADYWASTLRVHRASEPLRADRLGTGGSKFAFEPTFSYTGYQNPQCGTDGFVIPDKYLNPIKTCNKRCSPAFSCSGSCLAGGGCACNVETWSQQKTSYCCTPTFSSSCPSTCVSANDLRYIGTGNAGGGSRVGGILCENCTTVPGGVGAANEDVHLFVTIKDTPSCVSSGDLLAYASWCVKDQCDRPIFGTVTFCKSKLSLTPSDLDSQVSTAVHEMAHAFVFSSSLFRYFRNADGTPRIARDPTDQDNFPSGISWSCSGTGGTISFPNSNGDLYYVDLSPAIVGAYNERGFQCMCPIGANTLQSGCVVPTSGFRLPTCVTKVTMPTVLREVRDHFGCNTLEGAELENQDTSECVIIGSHWEQRIFNGEVMAPVGTNVKPYMSKVTLAMFEDSGWYFANFSMADPLTAGVHWGYKQGCNFAKDKCVSGGSPVSSRHFCTQSGTQACSLDRRSVASCGTTSYSGTPPAVFDYLPTEMSFATGRLPELDYCPWYSVALTNRVCTGSPTNSWVPFSNVNFMREKWGASSRCFLSTLRADVQTSGGTYAADPTRFTSARPVCYQVACAADGASYTVSADNLSGGTLLLGTCTSASQTLTHASLQGTLECAPPAELCQVKPALHTQTAFTGGDLVAPTTTASGWTPSTTASGATTGLAGNQTTTTSSRTTRLSTRAANTSNARTPPTAVAVLVAAASVIASA